MAAEALTLESLGVDLDALARRIASAQERAGRQDDTCATIAGVSLERWQAWKRGTERPGVARMPRISAATSAPVSWLMFDADPLDVIPKQANEQALNFARRAAAVLGEVVPLVESIARIAAEVERDAIPLAGGRGLAASLRESADTLYDANAVSEVPTFAHETS